MALRATGRMGVGLSEGAGGTWAGVRGGAVDIVKLERGGGVRDGVEDGLKRDGGCAFWRRGVVMGERCGEGRGEGGR